MKKRKANHSKKIFLTAIASAMIVSNQGRFLNNERILAGNFYKIPLDNDIFANATEAQRNANPYVYEKYEYQRKEKDQPLPLIDVRYNADGTVTVKATYNSAKERWSGRPMYGITVPKGFAMPEHIYRTVTSGDEKGPRTRIDVDRWQTGSRFVGLESTGTLDSEWSNRVITVGGYDGSAGDFNNVFKQYTQAIFLTWEKGGNRDVIELEYTTRVLDYQVMNNVLATFSQTYNRYSRHAGIYASKPKPQPAKPVAKTKAETYSFNYPIQTGVSDVSNLSSDEQNTIIQKIKDANNGLDGIARVSYDAGSKKFIVNFNEDNSRIEIPQSDLVYRENQGSSTPEQPIPANLNNIILGDKTLVPESVYNNIATHPAPGVTEAYMREYKGKLEVIARLIKANGRNVPTQPDREDMAFYGDRMDNQADGAISGARYTTNDQALATAGFNGGKPLVFSFVAGGKTYYLTAYAKANTNDGLKVYEKVGGTDSNPVIAAVSGNNVIPYSRLLYFNAAPDNSVNNDDKQQAKNSIDRILDPNKFPSTTNASAIRDGFKDRIDQANDRDAINAIIAEANNKAKELAQVEANKQLDLDKEYAKKIIDGLEHLTPERKNELKQAIDNIRVDDNTSYDDAKANVDAKMKEGLRENLNKAKDKAKAIVESLRDKDVISDNSANDVFRPNDLISTIDAISDNDLTPEKHQEEVEKLDKLTKKAFIDAEREKTLKDIDDSTLDSNTKENLKDEIKNNAPDGTKEKDDLANEKVADAKKALDQKQADAMKENAKTEIDNILGNGDEAKKNELKDKIDNATRPEEIESILDEAKAHKQKTDAKAAIDDLEYLNQAQKNALKQLIDEAVAVEDLDSYMEEARVLDGKMQLLAEETLKSKDLKDNNEEPYASAGNSSKTPFENALNEAIPVVQKDNASNDVNLDAPAVDALLNKLKDARLQLRPENENAKTPAELIRKEADEIKADLREKNKETKNYIKDNVNTENEDYVNASRLGSKDSDDAIGSIVNNAEGQIDAEVNKLANDGSNIDLIREELAKIKQEAEKQLAKEKLKAHIDKLKANIDSTPNTTGKDQESINAYEAEKAKATDTYNKAKDLYENGNPDLAMIEKEIEKVDQADKKLTEKEQLEDAVNVPGLNNKIAELDALIEKNRPTKFVASDKKDAVDQAITDANNALGSKQNPAAGTAREIANKPKPTKEEVNQKIAELTGKINALKQAQQAEKDAVKTRLDEIASTLLPEKDNAADPKLQPILDRVAKLSNPDLEDSDADKQNLENNVDTFINSVVDTIATDAVSNFTHLNNAQTASNTNLLKNTINAITGNGPLTSLSTELNNLIALDNNMAQLENIKAKADKIKEQVKYLKETDQAHKRAFDNIVDEITATINKANGSNKTKAEIDTMISNFNNALGNLDGKVGALSEENKVTVLNPAALTTDEKNAILDAIVNQNNDLNGKIDRQASSVSDTGVVTIVYNDGYDQNGLTVAKTPNSELAASEVLKYSFNNPVKTFAGLDTDGNLTAEDKEKVKDAIIANNPNLTSGENPSFTRDDITVNNDGSVSIQMRGENQPKTLTADQVVDKTVKKTAKDAMLNDARDAKAFVDALENLTPKMKDAIKTSIDRLANLETSYVDTKNPSTDKEILSDEDREAAHRDVVSQIDVAKKNYDFKLKQLIAKTAVSDKAEAVKKQIDAFENLNNDEKQALKNEVDATKDAENRKIDAIESTGNANNDDRIINTATNIAKAELDKDSAKADIKDKAEAIKDNIDALENLTTEEKAALKAEVDKTVEAENAKIEAVEPTGTPETDKAAIDTATNIAKAELDKDSAKADIKDKAEGIKKEIDGLTNINEDLKDKLKDQVDKTLEKALEDIDAVEITGNAKVDEKAINTIIEEAKEGLEKDRDHAIYVDRAYEIDRELKNARERERLKNKALPATGATSHTSILGIIMSLIGLIFIRRKDK